MREFKAWQHWPQWRGSLEWTGEEPIFPTDVLVIPTSGKRTYTRWPWGAWSSGVRYKFVGENWGKSPQAMVNMWRTWGPKNLRTVHSYVGCGTDGIPYALLSMTSLDPNHDRRTCEECSGE
jgi:hypothetical protein